MTIRKKDFVIKSRRTGNRLRGHENEVVYEIFTADGTKLVKSGFGKYRDADQWLSKSVAIAKQILTHN